MLEDNKLNEALLILMEESAEVAQASSKCIRFGGEPSKEELIKELGDFMCLYQILIDYDFIDPAKVAERVPTKLAKLKAFSSLFKD
jgi:NTP pyrophosphatase (non-canonical NTP hydrolase)